MSEPFIVVCGNLGAGKTTLSELICETTSFRLSGEVVDDNPYLPKFYADPASWVVKLNIFFLASRARAMFEAANAKSIHLLDRCLYEDIVFARVALDEGTIDNQYYEIFFNLHDVLTATLAPPAVMLYLHADLVTLHDRIIARRRNFEAGISKSYLSAIQQRYDEWIDGFHLCPVIRLNTQVIDFRRDTAALSTLIADINNIIT